MLLKKGYFEQVKTYPKSFWLLALSTFVFVMSFFLLLPEMNAYITDLGGADYKWMVLGLWTLAAAFARPFSGKIADNVSRKFVMYFGIVVSIIISFVYPLFLSVIGFLILRFLHGFSTGFQPTGATALIADIIPQGRRGEAMGIFGITMQIGMSAGQALGSPITMSLGINGLFMISGVLGIISLFILVSVEENNKPHLIAKAKGTRLPFVQRIIPRWNEVFAPEVIHPTIIMFITAMASGIYLVSIPDFSSYLGMTNKGLFFLVNLVFVIITRFLAGKFYDMYGARRNLYIGLSLLIVGAILTGTSTSVVQFLISGIVYGIAAGICSPALFAWTADLANPVFKGRGMATMFVALELGIMMGALMTRLVYANDPNRFYDLFVVLGLAGFIGIIYLFLTGRRKRANAPS